MLSRWSITSALLLSLTLAAAQVYARADGQDSLFIHGVIMQRDTLETRLNAFLRLGFERLDRDDPESARNAFNRALEIAPEDPRVFIGIGRCHLNRKDRRLRIFQIMERILDLDNVSRALDNFRKAVDLAPSSAEAHYWLGSAFMKRYGREDLESALHHLRKAAELGGINRDLALKLALLNKAVGNLDDAERVLAGIVESDGSRIDPLAGLELTKINISKRSYDEALRLYWRGVQDLSTAEEFKAYWDDVSMIADRSEVESFERTPVDSAEQFFREFWFKRDHEMDLSPGMRLLRHYHRLAAADSLYRVPYVIRNPSLGLLAATYPDVTIPYDDRGLVYLRHGPPDRTIRHIGEGFLPNESWVYYRQDERDLLLHFVGLNSNREYQLVNGLSSVIGHSRNFMVDEEGNVYPRDSEENTRLAWLREIYSSRLEIGDGLYFRLANRPWDPFTLMEEQAENNLFIRRALTSESVDSPYLRRLESYYDLVGFRGRRGGRSVLEFYLGVPGRDITFSRQQDGYYYDIAFELMVYDRSWRQVGYLNKAEQHKSSFNPHDLVDRLVLDLGSLDLPPGEYRYFARIQNGDAVGLYNGELKMDSFDGDSLQSSEILTAHNIFTSPADSSKFRRYGLEIHPNPSKTFHPTQKMYAYQEIYNLATDNQGNCNYRVTYVISTVRRDRNVVGRFYDTLKNLVGAGPKEERVVLEASKTRTPLREDMVQEEVAIDLTDNPDGVYELSVQVEDLNVDGRRTSRNTRFMVRK